MKRFVFLFMAAIILLGGSGCMALELNSEWHEAEVLKYLEGKYGEEFQINKVRDASWAYNFKTALCSPVANPDIQFEVRRSKEEGFLKYLNCDGYLLELMNQELYTYIEELTKGKWDDFKISTSVTTMNHIIDVPYTKGMTLQEFVSLNKWQNVFYNVDIYINVKSINRDNKDVRDRYFEGEPEKLYEIHKQIINNGYIASVMYNYLNQDMYDNVDFSKDTMERYYDIKNNKDTIYYVVLGSPTKCVLTPKEEALNEFDWRNLYD